MPKARKVTMTDVARRAQVSQATVSYVLNNVSNQSISEETRRSVMAAVEELGYRPNRAARDLVSGTSSVVVCVVPPIPLSEAVIGFLGELTATFAESGVVMAVHFERMGDESLEVMRKALAPRTVFSLFPRPGTDVFQIVDLASGVTDPGSRLQVEHMAERGHRRIAFAGSAEPELHDQSDDRWRSAAARAVELGLPAILMERVRTDAVGAAGVVARWHADGVTAVCANNDEVALAVLRGVHQAGLACPQDIAVIGYDATVVGASSNPPLTSVGWRPTALDVIAKAILSGRSVAEQDMPDPLDVWLVQRDSS
jgi:DNA-binding LacI/PurR family transcriptional regulator